MLRVENVRKESRIAQPICSTPKRSTAVRRSQLSRISRSSLRFSGPRSPGISPVSLTNSHAKEDFSDIDDFEETSIREHHRRSTRIHGNRSSRKEQYETQTRVHEIEMKRAAPRWGVCQSQRKVQYEPLVIASDEEEFIGTGKRGQSRKNQVKKPDGIGSTVHRNSVRGSDSECESLDSGKGASEAQVSVPLAMSSGPRIFENGSHPHASISTLKNFSQSKTSVGRVLKYDSGMEEVQTLPKEKVLDLISSVQWKSARACYEPLEIALSDEEDNDGTKKMKGRKKKPDKKCNANGVRTGGVKRMKEIVVHASFDDYEDDKEEDSEEEIVQNMNFDDTEDEYLDGIHGKREELRGDTHISGDESYQSVCSDEGDRQREASLKIYNERNEAEDVLNESFCSDDEDELLSGSATFSHNDYSREREKRFYDQERYQSVVRKPVCRTSCYVYDEEEEDKFEEDSVEFGTEYDMSGPCGDTSGRMLSVQEDVCSDEEMELLNTSGPRNGYSYLLHSQGITQNSKRHAVRGKPGRRRTVSQSSQTDVEDHTKESGKMPRKAPQKKKQPSQTDEKSSSVKRKRGRPSSRKTGEDVPKPKKPGRKKKSESQESSDNSPNDKTSGVVGTPTVKKTKRRVNKSVAPSDAVPDKKPNSRKRKSDNSDPSSGGVKIQEAKRKRTPKAGKSEKEKSESTTAPSEEGSNTVPKRKRKPPASNAAKSKEKKHKGKDSEEKAALCEEIAGKRRSLHNPNASQGLSLNNEESSSSSKDDSQHPFPLSPKIVRKRSAESSSDYLRKKVLTMRLGKSISHQSLMGIEEQIVTSTPVKPSSSKIALSSSSNRQDAEIVFFENAAKDECQPTVKEMLEKRISEETEDDSEKAAAVKNVDENKGIEVNKDVQDVEENKVNKINEQLKNRDEAEKTSSNVKDSEESPSNEKNLSKDIEESPSEDKENTDNLSDKLSKTLSKHSEKLFVNRILSEWPVDEICATSNEKLMQAPSKPSKVKAIVNGREQEIEAFIEYSQIKFHKHKKQNIQYGVAVNTPNCGSGFVHLTPGSEKGVSVAKQCNFVYVVLGGLVEVKLFNETKRLCRPGDFIVIPKGTKYNIAGRGDNVSALVFFRCQ